MGTATHAAVIRGDAGADAILLAAGGGVDGAADPTDSSNACTRTVSPARSRYCFPLSRR